MEINLEKELEDFMAAEGRDTRSTTSIKVRAGLSVHKAQLLMTGRRANAKPDINGPVLHFGEERHIRGQGCFFGTRPLSEKLGLKIDLSRSSRRPWKVNQRD